MVKPIAWAKIIKATRSRFYYLHFKINDARRHLPDLYGQDHPGLFFSY
jgi:hypothetical protein